MKIGPNFGDDLAAAGIGTIPISWRPDGTILGRDNLSEDEKVLLDLVLAEHVPDPSKGPVLPPLPPMLRI